MIKTLALNEIEIYFRHFHIQHIPAALRDNYHNKNVSFVIQLTLFCLSSLYSYHHSLRSQFFFCFNCFSSIHFENYHLICINVFLTRLFTALIHVRKDSELFHFFFLRCSGVSRMMDYRCDIELSTTLSLSLWS